MSRTHHSFEIEEAKIYGIEKAILLFNLRWWLEKNKANRVNCRDGYYWTYNSSKAFAELFPYMNQRSIRRWLQDLEELGVIKSGNYNKNPYDNTKWYTMPAEYGAPGHFGQRVDESEPRMTENGQPRMAENGQSITDSNPDHKPDINPPHTPQGEGVDDTPMDLKNENTNTLGLPEGVEERMVMFRAEVISQGTTTYTKLMLDQFFDYWTELDRGKKPRMRYEKQKAFEVRKRLNSWATNNLNKIECYLTDAQKSIQEKRLAFAKTIESYKGKYSRAFLLDFYQYWSQPEKGQRPQYLRYEKEEFWDLATRLAQRHNMVINK